MAEHEWIAKLDTYLDGELSTTEMKAFHAHVRSCSLCTAEILKRVQMKKAVQMAGKRYTPSAEFRLKIQQQVAPRKVSSLRRLSLVFTFALALVLIAGLAIMNVHQRKQLAQERAYTEIADLHIATLASSNPVDVISTDRHTVKPWFQNKLPFNFNLPELQGTEFTLIGGRLAYLGQTPGAQLIYRVRKHEISVFIFQEQALKDWTVNPGLNKQLSFNVESWNQSGLRYFIIGGVDAKDIHDLSELLKKVASS